ncbi:MAG: DNA/RNA nuclease SfsA [Cyanobacteria bacterium P01_G01_bin.38]
MTRVWSYPLPPLQKGTLLKRYKRFLADIELETGEVITAHCPNTGPMTGVCHINGQVMVSHSDNPKRKLAYTWELAEVGETQPVWAGVNTALPNRVIRAALDARVFPQLADYPSIRPEVPYGEDRKSRIDFLLTAETAPPCYVEVKNTTWAKAKCALFPDTVTTRGQKHLRELTALLPQARAVMLYFINRGDCPTFAPGDEADPTYGQLLRQAVQQGVEILPCRFQVTPTEVQYLGQAEIQL